MTSSGRGDVEGRGCGKKSHVWECSHLVLQ